MRGNPNPKHKLKQLGEEAMAKLPLAVRVPVDIDEYVRSLPNRAEWLRKLIVEAVERERQATEDCP